VELTVLAAGALVLAVLVVAAVDNWTYTLLGLLAQYLVVAYFLTGDLFVPGLSVVRFGLGILVVAGLYLNLRELGSGRHSGLPTLHRRARQAVALGPPAIAAVVIALAAGVALTVAYPWPGLLDEVSFSAYFLASAGLMILVLPADILRHGMGLLLLENAAHLLRFSVAESADLVELAFTGVAVVVLALVVAHLADRMRTPHPEDEGP
jgi:hypothetical protein